MDGPIVGTLKRMAAGMPDSASYELAWVMAHERAELFQRIREAEWRDYRAFRESEMLKHAYGDRIVSQVVGL